MNSLSIETNIQSKKHVKYYSIVTLIKQLPRYYRLAKIFKFFIYNKYIYASIFRDLFEKVLKDQDWVRPRNVVLKLDQNCNARCKFCYAARDLKTPDQKPTFWQWCSYIDKTKNLGCYTVTLSGGEPLIYPHLIALVKYVTRKKMLAFTTTNGIAAEPEMIMELEKAGLCAISFSIHGPEEHHDKIVGVKGAFRKAIKNLEFVAKHTHLICRVSHVVTKQSICEGWYNYIWDLVRPFGVRTLSLLPICINSLDDSELLNDDELRIFDSVAWGNDYISMDIKNYSKPLCPAAREDLFINNFGEVQPCPFIPISFGNLNQEPLKDIFLRMQKHPMFTPQANVCLPARDLEFIEQYIFPAFMEDGLPTRIDKIDATKER